MEVYLDFVTNKLSHEMEIFNDSTYYDDIYYLILIYIYVEKEKLFINKKKKVIFEQIAKVAKEIKKLYISLKGEPENNLEQDHNIYLALAHLLMILEGEKDEIALKFEIEAAKTLENGNEMFDEKRSSDRENKTIEVTKQQNFPRGDAILIFASKLLNNKEFTIDQNYERYQSFVEELDSGNETTFQKLIGTLESARNRKDLSILLNILSVSINLSIKKIEKNFEEFEFAVNVESELKIDLIFNFHQELILYQLPKKIFNGIQNLEKGWDKILLKYLKIANSVLEVCNPKIQKSFFQQFEEDEYNVGLLILQQFLKNLYHKISKKEEEVFEMVKYFSKNGIKESDPISLKQTGIFESNYFEYYKSEKEQELFSAILNFFKGMCEGHYDDMQKFLFVQTKKGDEGREEFPKQIELVDDLINNIWEEYNYIANPFNLNTGSTILYTLIEIIQGDLSEELEEISIKVCENINKLFFKINDPSTKEDNLFYYKELYNKSIPDEKYRETLYYQRTSLNLKILQFINSVIEISNKVTKNRLAKDIKWIQMLEILTKRIENFYASQNIPNIQIASSKTLLNCIDDTIYEKYFLEFSYLWINIDMLENFGEGNKTLSSMIYELRTTNEVFYKTSLKLKSLFNKSIEIIDEKGDLRKVYFPKYVICNHLTQKMKNLVMTFLDRTSYETKIAEFFGNKEILMTKMREDYNIIRFYS